jgi:hypothetical protein
MENKNNEHTPLWAYLAAVALLAALVFIQANYFSAEATSVSHNHSQHSQHPHG